MIDFVIIGAQKSGTTSLAYQLGQHPSICFSKQKEPGFFNRPTCSPAALEEYHALYSPSPGQICGEASTMYTFLPEWTDTHVRLQQYNPKLRLIYIMRDPIERIISHYAHRLLYGRVNAPPEIAIFEDPAYINRSSYAFQIAPYLDTFTPQSVLMLVFEDYARDPVSTLRRVAMFLEVDPTSFDSIDMRPQHVTTDKLLLKNWVRIVRRSPAGKAVRPFIPSQVLERLRRRFSSSIERKPELPRSVRRTLWRQLSPDVAQMERLLDRRLDEWRNVA